MLACKEIITIIRCDGENYRTAVFENVSYFAKSKVAMEGRGLAFANMISVRIPEASISEGAMMPAVGDSLVKGRLAEDLLIETRASLAPYELHTVMEVGDNRRGSLPHMRLACQ